MILHFVCIIDVIIVTVLTRLRPTLFRDS